MVWSAYGQNFQASSSRNTLRIANINYKVFFLLVKFVIKGVHSYYFKVTVAVLVRILFMVKLVEAYYNNRLGCSLSQRLSEMPLSDCLRHLITIMYTKVALHNKFLLRLWR